MDTRNMRAYDTPADQGVMTLRRPAENETAGDHAPLAPEAAEETRSLIGALIFIGTTTRPDVAQAVCRVARHMSVPTEASRRAARRILLYLLRTATLGLTYGGGVRDDAILRAMHKAVGSDAEGGAGQRTAVQNIYWYHTGIWATLDSFGSGVVYQICGMVFIKLDFYRLWQTWFSCCRGQCE